MYFTPIEIKPRNGARHELAEQTSVIAIPEDYSGNTIRLASQRLEDARGLSGVKRLFSVIWQSNELHMLFADTGIGKSILAVGLADALSKGNNFLNQENDHDPLTVLYYDFEMSDRQFRRRYSDENSVDHAFSSRFYIDTIDVPSLIIKHPKKKLDEILFQKIRHDITILNAEVLIIDNLTYLNTFSTQETQVAMETMKRLTELKNEFGISILVLAHTPKKSPNTPITINDMAGSKHLSNFADSVSAIGKSIRGKNYRYIKQVKPSRSSEILYDADWVLCCEIIKSGSMLSFDHAGNSPEMEHLNIIGKSAKDDLKEYAHELKNQGLSIREISDKIDVPHSTVHRWFKSTDQLSHVGQMGQSGQNGTDGTCPF